MHPTNASIPPAEEFLTGASLQAPVRVPVVVITGYLGSGKTTLIASLLQRPEMQGTAVIVNELAEAGIDQSVIGDAGPEGVVLLSNGCMCCSGGSDLRNAVARLLRQPGGRVRRILIETSGGADPGPIVRQICFDPVLRPKLRYAGVLTLFDAQNGPDLLVRDPVGLRQIGISDHMLVTKIDLVDSDTAAAAQQFLKALNATVQTGQSIDSACRFVIEAGRGISALDVTTWLGDAKAVGFDNPHQQLLQTWSVYGRKPLLWERVEPVLGSIFERHGSDVIRTKGLLWTEGDDRPMVIHGINRHFHRPVRLSGWNGQPMSRVVVIGFAGAASAAEEIAIAVSGTVSPRPDVGIFAKPVGLGGGLGEA